MMRGSVWAGIALIVVGIVVYLRGGFTKKEEVVDVGPLSVSHTEKQHIPPWVAGLVVAGGVVLVAAGMRQRA
jgi:drug/metabolite transporter (DMT)-like permease